MRCAPGYPAMFSDALSKMPGARLSRMSGSGATCFALFDNRKCTRSLLSTSRMRTPPDVVGAGDEIGV